MLALAYAAEHAIEKFARDEFFAVMPEWLGSEYK
jgi:hypothetical protein